jgi:hypothetical protein
MDNGDRERDTERMLRPGDARCRMERTLNAAYGGAAGAGLGRRA